MLADYERFSFIAKCIWRMMIASRDAIGLLFACCYLYAVLGVMLFGGLVYDDQTVLDGTDYRDGYMDVLNFNDHGLALVSLFCMLVTAFVPEFYQAYSLLYKPTWVPVTYWISF